MYVEMLYFSGFFYCHFNNYNYFLPFTASDTRARENTEMGQDGKELGQVYTWRKGKKNFNSTLKIDIFSTSPLQLLYVRCSVSNARVNVTGLKNIL